MQSTLAPTLTFAPIALGLAACLSPASGEDTGAMDAEANDAAVPNDVGSASDVGPTDLGAADSGALADSGASQDSGAPDSGLDAGGSNDAGAACSYPPGAVEPMALEEILSPYRWPVALEVGTGRQIELDLTKVHCNEDSEIDWRMINSLLFVSVPAF